MSTYGTQQAAPNADQTLRAVALFTLVEFVAALGIQSYLVGPLPVIFPTIGICISVGLIGALIIAFEKARAGGTPPSGPIAGLLVIIIAVILGAFFYSHGHKS